MPGAAPAPHAMAAGRDYDFDCRKPFFCDRAWDLSRSTAPSEDIRTKFEPLPTWPPSPTLLPPSGDPCYDGTAGPPEGRSVVSDRGGGGGCRSGAGAVELRDCTWSAFSSARASTNTARQCNQQQQQQRSAPAHASHDHIPPVHQEEHDYSAPSPPPCKAENPPAARRFRPAAAPAPPPPAGRATRSRGGFSRAVSSRAVSSGCGSPRSSGSEYRAKRNARNYLERQRRSDLRHGFLRLRDLIPELAHNDKAGRVLILRKATEYASTLQRQEKQLEEKKQRLKIRQQELLKRLEIVRNSQAERSRFASCLKTSNQK